MSEWIVLVDYICKDNQYPWPLCKLVLKHKNMINGDKWESWTNEKWDFSLINGQFVFFVRPPYEKYQE